MQNKNTALVATVILGVFFFIFGFVTWLNSTLIPYLKIACELTTAQSQLVAFAFYISYFVMALPSSFILEKTGFKKGMMLGLVIMAIGAFIFIPAAQTRTYNLFLTGLFVIGTGLSLLQTASNPYITIAGPIESAARRISIMGICNKVAGVLAPIIMGAIILADAATLETDLKLLDETARTLKLNELASRVITPYTFMAVALLVLALLVQFSPLPDIENQEEAIDAKSGTDKTSVFQFPNLVLGVVALFLYVGVEVMAGDTIGLYGQTQGINLEKAKIFGSYTLSAMVVGYILGIILIPKYITQSKALAISAIVGMAFSAAAIFTSGFVSVLFIALLGSANALMWPAIWPLAIDGLGKFTKTGSALLIMAIAGGAILPLLWGKLADVPSIGHQQAYWLMVPCYGFILWYSVKAQRK
ncbi:MAG: sugar MFS transporter [Chitinophagales bacterium]|nr:sugar MFS transporter [Chitinophagales bacterium]